MNHTEPPELSNIEKIEKAYYSKCEPEASMIECALYFGLKYIDLRNYLTVLVDGGKDGKLDEYDMEVYQDTALRYLIFIKDNFKALCEAVSLKPEFEDVELYEDDRNPYDLFYGLRPIKSKN